MYKNYYISYYKVWFINIFDNIQKPCAAILTEIFDINIFLKYPNFALKKKKIIICTGFGNVSNLTREIYIIVFMFISHILK